MFSKRNIYAIVIAIIIFLLAMFIVNLIWFRPFSVKIFYYKEMVQSLKHDPQTASKAKALYFYKRSRARLNDISPEGMDTRIKHYKKYSSWLNDYSEKGLFSNSGIDREMIQWHLDMEARESDFKYYDYPINPYNGFQVRLPSYLIKHHYIENKKDIKAYHDRLLSIPDYFDQLKERFAKSRQTGTLPPVKMLDVAIAQMEAFINEEPVNNPLYLSFKQKLDTIPNLRKKDAYLATTKEIIEQTVYPAYRDLIEFAASFRLLANKKIGVYNFPNGKAYYEYLIERQSSLDISPDSMFNLGISETWRIKDLLVEELSKIDSEVDRRNVIEKLKILGSEQQYRLDNSIQGRIQCRILLDSLVSNARVYTAEWFDKLPEASVTINRIPTFKEAISPIAYYEIAPMDGSSSASFNIRMDILDEIPTFSLPTLTFHETYPGHHYQLAAYLESNDIPMYRKRFQNNGYIEGWAMYAELLAYENGVYENDPMGNIGRLHAMLFRAARMVTDIGIHYKEWPRENAIIFLSKNTMLSKKMIESEVDRYAIDPAQGVTYTSGLLKFLQLRDKAKKELGNDFKLNSFNQMLMSNGVVPFFVLEKMVDDFISDEKKN
jgi:uncharacterized protein (DUF885 family)